MILDSEVLMVDADGKILPFGSLGIHKKEGFKNAQPCLFIFDILEFNGASLLSEPLHKRRELLEKNVKAIPRRVMHSELYEIKSEAQLDQLFQRTVQQGLEGLVVKDRRSLYEPDKRHWLKIKKDYVNDKATGKSMSDSADLVVLGAYFGTGSKGGIMSVFLMGCVDDRGVWKTVCKVGNGLDDMTTDLVNKELDVMKISKDPARVPSWLRITKSDLIPDFVVRDPKMAPVWEIRGAEFSKSERHTADGISMRHPRVIRFRKDKDWRTATDLKHLHLLVEQSGGQVNVACDDEEADLAAEAMDIDVTDKLESETEVSAAKLSAPGKRKRTHPAVEDNEQDSVAETGSSVRRGDDQPAKCRRVRPPCPYGSACYRKNEVHRRDQTHPGEPDYDASATAARDIDHRASNVGHDTTMDSDADNTEDSIPAVVHHVALDSWVDLPDVFRGVTAFVPADAQGAARLRRYLIAYDADVVSGPEGQPSHIIIESSDPATWTADLKKAVEQTPTAHLVTLTWVWACIQQRKLLPETYFSLTAGH